MKVGSIKGLLILAAAMLAGLALTPFVQGFNGKKGIL